tara:strand:- start:12455 stop:12928 length:474 start_codon:yes stop_codon:yes gene_type:complete
MTKAEAVKLGLNLYNTGKPCKRGHMADRYVYNRTCLECAIIGKEKHHKQKYKKQRLKILAQVKEYKKNNKGLIAALNAKRKASKKNRTPKWLTVDDTQAMKEIYKLAKIWEETTGIKWHVDHIIPLQGKNVSGLHTPNNIQVITAEENNIKSNKYGD